MERGQIRHSLTVLFFLLLGAGLLWGMIRWAGRLPEPEPPPEGVRISEVMTRNGTIANGDGVICDWIELENTTSETADLGGWGLSDREDEVKYTFPAGTKLPAGGFAVVFCSKDHPGDRYAPFALAGEGGETLTLTDPRGRAVDAVTTISGEKEGSLIRREDGTLTFTLTPTPGYPNTETGEWAQLRAAFDLTGISVEITEAMAKNKGVLFDADGDLPDWLELRNEGAAAVDLSGWFLSDDPEKPEKWEFPAGSLLGPGSELLVFASGKDRAGAELHTSFSLKAGESVILSAPSGEEVSRLDTAGLTDGRALAVTQWGTEETDWATPGYPNTAAGYAAREEARLCDSPLQIREVVTANVKAVVKPEKELYDLVEVQNVSDETLSLAGWTLSDDPRALDAWAFPDIKLRRGERLILRCSGDESLSTKGTFHTSFRLGTQGEGLFLCRDGAVMDSVWLHDVPYGGSLGRMDGENGFFYFAAPNPGRVKRDGKRTVARTPELAYPDGVFEGVESVTVAFRGEDPIRYTTDGSVPTARSKLYEGPFTVSETTVIRAAAFADDKLQSPAFTAAYILNEGHTLPVVSLAGDKTGLKRMLRNFRDEIEVPVGFVLFDGEERYSIDAGVKMFGHKSLELSKKSYKLVFRGRYGQASLTGDLFGAGERDYASLVLRSGQDYPNAVIREELFTSLAADLTEDVIVQDSRYCVMYLNGEYYGIYALKEAYSEEMYAAKRDVPAESVTLSQAPVSMADPFREVLDFARQNDLAEPENYEAFCGMVDIHSLIDWLILESYSTNSDIQQNLRYFRSTAEDNRWRFAFYDLDWAFYNELTIFAGMAEKGMAFQPYMYLHPLEKNEEFRRALFSRLAEALQGPLSAENVVRHIDELEAQLAPEMARERARWPVGGTWSKEVQLLRDFAQSGWDRRLVEIYIRQYDVTEAEQREFFAPWLG